MESKELLKKIAIEGTPAEKLALFQFDESTSDENVLKKFKYFARSCYPRYFTAPAAPYHDDMVMDYINSYRGKANVLEAAHRDAAKTALLKLFIAFVVVNDKDHLRKYIKVLSKELTNAKLIVTDVYNMIVEVIPIYGDPFLDEGKKKREETQGSFTTKDQVKVRSGTVGQGQRGNIQDAYRPDWQIFEDIEDSDSVTSQAKTEAIKLRIQEAIDGRAQGSKYAVNCNYISEDGNIQWLMEKPGVRVRIMPIAEDVRIGRDEEGVQCLEKATAIWPRFTFNDLQERFQDSIDWYGEFMCLKPDTLILTSNGWKQIKDVRVGDTVKTHKNKNQKVLKVFESESDDLLDITVGEETITITREHPVWAERNGLPVWIKAGELTLDDLVMVIPRGKLTT